MTAGTAIAGAVLTEQSLAYLAQVSARLVDLDQAERDELLEDLALHLAALEDEAGEQSLEERLGAPAAYADDLRSAAGLPPAPEPSSRRTRVLALAVRVAQPVRDFAPQLLPAWWVARGYLAVLLLSLLPTNGERDFPVPAPAGSHALGVLAVLAAVVLSVALGTRTHRRWQVVIAVVVDVALLVGALATVGEVRDRLVRTRYVQVAAADPFHDSSLITRRGPVTNLFAYSLDGTPLANVLLFDQDGRPLRTGEQRWWADHCRRVVAAPKAADGVAIEHAYPKAYVLDPARRGLSGTNVVDPATCTATTAPEVVLPQVASRP